jgi:hypothetical protein
LRFGQEAVEWLYDRGTVGNKTVVKIYKSQELTEFANRGWNGKLLNGSNSLLQGLDAVCTDSVPQEIQFSDSELAF